MTKKPEGCEKFEEVINKIINKGNVPPEELNVLLDNPLADSPCSFARLIILSSTSVKF